MDRKLSLVVIPAVAVSLVGFTERASSFVAGQEIGAAGNSLRSLAPVINANMPIATIAGADQTDGGPPLR
ncbi:MAG TPA: hypothetical protein VME46_05925 [Acidimicrobiales bacterium]|nr:hypothetical protein [Acidimicrobiales bacterium]